MSDGLAVTIAIAVLLYVLLSVFLTAIMPAMLLVGAVAGVGLILYWVFGRRPGA